MTINCANQFSPKKIYLNTATVGLPCHATVDAMQHDIAHWQFGELNVPAYDEVIKRCRDLFAGLIHTSPDCISIGHQVAPFMTLLAQSLKPGTRILSVDNDFTSVLFPFFVREPEIDVELVSLSELPSKLEQDRHFDWVALSAVQSSNGKVADLDAISEAAKQTNTRIVLDGTHAVSWLNIRPEHWDMLVCGAYKWLLSPRGTAFAAIKPELMESIPPIMANWYAGEHVWESIYGAPVRLANTARRYDVSPAWLPWVGTLPALELINSVGIDKIGSHNIALANRFRRGMEMEDSNSAIVSLQQAGIDEKLQAAGVSASIRAGAARLSFHLYNTEDEVDQVLAILA